MKLLWTASSKESYELLKTDAPELAEKVKSLLKDTVLHSDQGSGAPIKLEREYSGLWQRTYAPGQVIVYSVHEDAVTIEEEEEFINAYLQLQSYRFGDRISFNVDISEECKKILIPKLTLVTFVENACVHGIESKSSQGWIFVRVYKNDDQLVIEVEDTGDGMDEKEVELLQQNMNNVTIDTIKKAKHVGILNACLRIKMMFKDQAKFTIESEKGIGMSVIIMIPSDMITTA